MFEYLCRVSGALACLYETWLFSRYAREALQDNDLNPGPPERPFPEQSALFNTLGHSTVSLFFGYSAYRVLADHNALIPLAVSGVAAYDTAHQLYRRYRS